jgi:hypothetical protein
MCFGLPLWSKMHIIVLLFHFFNHFLHFLFYEQNYFQLIFAEFIFFNSSL